MIVLKHLVLIVGKYYPQPSPTGKCAREYISLLKDKYNVDVVFIQYGIEAVYGIKNNDETLYGLSNWRLWSENWLFEKRSRATSKLCCNLLTLGILALKTIGRLQSVFLFPNNLQWFYKSAYRTLCLIHKENPIDVVFTVSSPFSAHLAGEQFKKSFPDVKWVTYTVDPFSVSHKSTGLLRRASNKAVLAEHRILSNADTNFLSEEIYENRRDLYQVVKSKTLSLPYLMPANSNMADNSFFDSSKINLVYAGRFYKDIRNPEVMLKTMLLTGSDNIVLHLYVTSDCEDLVDQYVKMSAGKIIRHCIVSTEEIQKILLNADILICIGNSVPEFKPSKVFEYIATGRPIINFYQNGIVDEVLTQYPVVLQISNMQNEAKSASETERFCLTNQGKRVEFSKIETVYMKHSAKNIKKILLNGLE